MVLVAQNLITICSTDVLYLGYVCTAQIVNLKFCNNKTDKKMFVAVEILHSDIDINCTG